METTYLEWAAFKIVATIKGQIRVSENAIGNFYRLFYKDEAGVFETAVLKDNGADHTDFENNYSALVNKAINPQRDSDGAYLQRVKVTTSGWAYQLHGINFATSTLNGAYSAKADGTSHGFLAEKFYELVNGVETQITGENLNQTYLDSNCIKTIIDWEPTHDYELMGGMLMQKARPASSIKMWSVGVPDVPAVYGGSKEFISDLDLAFVSPEKGMEVDGRAPKYMTYSATYHTNKMRLIFRHGAGVKHEMHMVFEIFKA